MIEPISDADLHAFIDDRLDPLRRLEVADHLAQHPEQAARVMGDVRSQEALRILFAEARWPVANRTVAAARKLERAFRTRQVFYWTARAAGVVLLVGLGWFAHLKAGAFDLVDHDRSGQKAFVVDAVHAYRTQLLRAQMNSFASTRIYDPKEIRAVTEIVMPPLLPGWQVTDVEVVPTHEGAGIEAMITTDSNGGVALFAARTDQDATIPPTVAKSETETTVYWQQGAVLYALTGTGDEPRLQQLAAIFVNELD